MGNYVFEILHSRYVNQCLTYFSKFKEERIKIEPSETRTLSLWWITADQKQGLDLGVSIY